MRVSDAIFEGLSPLPLTIASMKCSVTSGTVSSITAWGSLVVNGEISYRYQDEALKKTKIRPRSGEVCVGSHQRIADFSAIDIIYHLPPLLEETEDKSFGEEGEGSDTRTQRDRKRKELDPWIAMYTGRR